MPKIRRGIFFVLLLSLISCSEKPQNQKANSPNPEVGSDIAQLAASFLADSAQTRLVILLSPT